MKKVISTERIPIKLWLSDIEEGALEQAKNLANLPFAFKHIVICPDAHQGYGMPIGGVMATKDVVVPNAVGSDIGCGVCAVKTNLKTPDRNIIEQIINDIKSKIPVGKKWQQKEQNENWMPDQLDYSTFLDQLYKPSLKQIGTLGGGNHFIEIQKDSDNFIWIMIHSGSRNLGFQVAKHYKNIAIELNKKWFSQVPKKWDLAYLPIDSKEGKNYLKEMKYCVNFALANRSLMMHNVYRSILKFYPGTNFDKMINIPHNYASIEHHFNSNVMIHRKGATSAYLNELGIIPGSQGTNSYIVSGLGNRDSFMSCSHGAGRKMGRNQAIKKLDFKTEVGKLDKLGIIHSIKNQKNIDEAPGAYKDISVVMANQEDLVKIEVELKPLGVVKGK